MFAIYLFSSHFSHLHLSFSCCNSFLSSLPPPAAATGFLTENFNDRPTFPRPIYGISYDNVKHRDKCASDGRRKDKQHCNGTTRRLSRYPRQNSLAEDATKVDEMRISIFLRISRATCSYVYLGIFVNMSRCHMYNVRKLTCARVRSLVCSAIHCNYFMF